MGYLVLHADSYTRKVSLTNTCNKPRIAIKSGNGTSYIPVNANKNGNKNIKVSNSYVDIRISSKVNTTTNTTSASNYQTYRQVNYATTYVYYTRTEYGDTATYAAAINDNGTQRHYTSVTEYFSSYDTHDRQYYNVTKVSYQDPSHGAWVGYTYNNYKSSDYSYSISLLSRANFTSLRTTSTTTGWHVNQYNTYITSTTATNLTVDFTYEGTEPFTWSYMTGGPNGTSLKSATGYAYKYSYRSLYAKTSWCTSINSFTTNTTSASNSYYNTTSQVNTTTGTTSVSYY